MKRIIRVLILGIAFMSLMGVTDVQAETLQERLKVIEAQVAKEREFEQSILQDKDQIQEDINAIENSIEVVLNNIENIKDEEELSSHTANLEFLQNKSHEAHFILESIIEEEENTFQSIKYLENEIKTIKEQIKAQEASKPNTADQVIAYAKKFLGTPYVYGGTSPSGFDCSGFVQYVFRNSVGIKLGRTTYDQIYNGRAVSRGELVPGDLVFFGSWSNPYHVGIYVGNGQFIHSPRTGDVVKVSDLSSMQFFTGVRVIK